MKFTITVTVDGDTKDYQVLPVDILDFEDEFNVSAEALGDPDKRRMKHLFYLAWLAATRVGDTSEGFRDWLSRDVEFGGIEDESVPLDGS